MLTKNMAWRVSLLLGISLIVVMVTGAMPKVDNSLTDLNLTDEQVVALGDLSKNLYEKNLGKAVVIAGKFHDLEVELKREGRFESEEKGKEASEKVNKIVKEVSGLFGQMLKDKVDYFVKAKDVLTVEQRKILISSLDFDLEVPENLNYYKDVDTVSVWVDLDYEQQKKLNTYQTEMKIEQLRIELEIKNTIIDIEEEISRDEIDTRSVNKAVMEIADLAVRAIDNRVNHFLKAKDVLTLSQKKELLQMLMIQ